MIRINIEHSERIKRNAGIHKRLLSPELCNDNLGLVLSLQYDHLTEAKGENEQDCCSTAVRRRDYYRIILTPTKIVSTVALLKIKLHLI